MSESFRCGYVTLIGRPSVGKSSLLNRLVGRKVSITSPHPQTTRRLIHGINTRDDAQIIYVDTPGVYAKGRKGINRLMGRAARAGLEGMDCIVFVISATGWVKQDDAVLDLVRNQPCPVILCINKIDKIKDKKRMLPLVDQLSKKMDFRAIVPASARSQENIEELGRCVLDCLPEREAYFPPDQFTDCSERFISAEMIREQIFRSTREEVPHATAVIVDKFKREKKKIMISATIWVEKEGQKPILIGKGGAGLKSIGSRARREMEKWFGAKVSLSLWVKVRKKWSDNINDLITLGYNLEE